MANDSKRLVAVAPVVVAMLFACSNKSGSADDAGVSPVLDAGATEASSSNQQDAASDGTSKGGSPDASSGADASGSSADSGAPATCITLTTPQACTPPSMTALPLCKLSDTGCMSATNPTQFATNAQYYEVNSPLWSDDAAKSRAFVLPDGGTIHVKNCLPDAGAAALAECVAPNGIANGPADTGRWVFPVGTVLIKNFMFDGKLVETRLIMHVDPATAALIANGTDWVGYNYAWNEAQTEALIVNDQRTSVQFNTGTETVTWNYPNWLDCTGCHAGATGSLGPETAQMNRIVDGGNQIDLFVAKKFFDSTAPTKPYTAAMVEPYANAKLGLVGPPDGSTVNEEARSYLSANCGYCHRPDVNDQGFDLRYSLTLYQTKACDLVQQNGIPGDDAGVQPFEFNPGNHAKSALWLRMNIEVPDADTNGEIDVGRMPSVGTNDIDTQAVSIIGSWIDSYSACPGPDAGW